MTLNLILLLIRNFCQRKSHKTVIEMLMGNLLANRTWTCYLEKCDSSGEFVHFGRHLKLSSDKRLTDAKDFLYLDYSGWRRHFALDAIILLVKWYWQLDFKSTNAKGVSLLCILNQIKGRTYRHLNIFEIPFKYAKCISYNFCGVYIWNNFLVWTDWMKINI